MSESFELDLQNIRSREWNRPAQLMPLPNLGTAQPICSDAALTDCLSVRADIRGQGAPA